MTTTVTKCDRCGAIISEDVLDDDGYKIRYKDSEMDLCNKCYAQIEVFLFHWLQPERFEIVFEAKTKEVFESGSYLSVRQMRPEG